MMAFDSVPEMALMKGLERDRELLVMSMGLEWVIGTVPPITV